MQIVQVWKVAGKLYEDKHEAEKAQGYEELKELLPSDDNYICGQIVFIGASSLKGFLGRNEDKIMKMAVWTKIGNLL